MTLCAFVTREACQYLNVVNLVQTYIGDSPAEQRFEPGQNVEFGKRFVYGFFTCNFCAVRMIDMDVDLLEALAQADEF